MTFQKFEALVKAHCPKVYSVSQKAHTQDTGVLVTYSKGGRGYIYKGSYFDILSKLGMNYITVSEVNHYHNRITSLEDFDDGFGDFGIHTPRSYQNIIDDLKREVNSYTGATLVSDSGDDLGVFQGL